MSSLAGERVPREGWKRYMPQTGPQASTGPRGFGAVPQAVPLLTHSGRRFHRTFCTGPQHLLSSRLDSQEHRGEHRETVSRPLPCSQRCVWVAARATGRAGKSGSLSLRRRTSVSPGVTAGPCLHGQGAQLWVPNCRPFHACSQCCKQPCIKSSPRFPSDPSWGLVVGYSFPRRGPWDKSPSAPACQYLHA